MNFLRFNESVSFSLVSPSLVQIKDDYERSVANKSAFIPSVNPGSQGQSGLQVKLAASHAGMITRNNGFYLPNEMRDGVSSFTDGYPHPVLLHHNEDQDPVGRIIQAEYVDTSGAIIDKYKGLEVKDRLGNPLGTLTDTLLHDYVHGKMPFGQQVDITLGLLRDSILEDAGYSGLGYAVILANITDPDAIQKLLDGRYITGSVGVSTDRAVCSVCKHDWATGSTCEHRPGAIYDKIKCFLVMGKLTYNEYSLVNVPADRHSKVLELNYNGIRNSVEIANDFNSRIHEVQLSFPQYDSVKEEINMPPDAQTGQDTVSTPEGTPPEGTVTPEIKDETAANSTPTVEDSSAENKTEDTVVVQDATTEETAPESTSTPEAEVAAPEFDLLMDKFLSEETLSEEEEEQLYDAIWKEVQNAVADGELEATDAKLSSEKRKKLASSSFCGPGKSFPVPDCSHVTAARRLIGRYKGSGDKSKILACVSRKAKAMGCDKSKKDSVEPVVPVSTQDNTSHAYVMRAILEVLTQDLSWNSESALTDEEKEQLAMVMKRLASLVPKDALVQVLEAEGLSVSQANQVALEDEIVKNEETIGELRDTVAALRKEYNDLYGDLEKVQDSLATEKAKTRQVTEKHYSTLMTLQEKTIEPDILVKMTSDALESGLDQALRDIDMKKIVDKLNDGMARVPEGAVENPIPPQEKRQEEYNLKDLAWIDEQFKTLRLKHGQVAAENFLKRMRAEGRLPSAK